MKDINFVVYPGQTVAFVGSTGAGKTSIINLITRFYDIQKGDILLDDVNIKDIDKYELRKHLGVALQYVFLFTATIEDNIRLNNLDISRQKVEEVSEYVNATHFINRLKDGYEEPVMERGSTLSIGERQLLIFGEATANIDTETEMLIQDTLGKLIKGRTSIAIAHRLSTIQHADNIIVLNKGKIIETGNHQELLGKEGIYYNLYKLQYSKQ